MDNRRLEVEKMVTIMSPEPVWACITFRDCAEKLYAAGYRASLGVEMIAWLMRRLNSKDAAEFMLAISTVGEV